MTKINESNSLIKVSPSASNELQYSKKKVICNLGTFEKKQPVFIINKSIKRIVIITIFMYIQVHSMASKLKNICTIVYYVPRRTVRVIARRAPMLAGDESQGVVDS